MEQTETHQCTWVVYSQKLSPSRYSFSYFSLRKEYHMLTSYLLDKAVCYICYRYCTHEVKIYYETMQTTSRNTWSLFPTNSCTSNPPVNHHRKGAAASSCKRSSWPCRWFNTNYELCHQQTWLVSSHSTTSMSSRNHYCQDFYRDNTAAWNVGVPNEW